MPSHAPSSNKSHINYLSVPAHSLDSYLLCHFSAAVCFPAVTIYIEIIQLIT